MRVLIEATWDDDVQVWVATSKSEIGLATEALTVEALQAKLPAMIQDLLGDDLEGQLEIELVARNLWTVAA